MINFSTLTRILALVVGCSLAHASDAPACDCESIGRLNDDGSVTLHVTSLSRSESTWRAVLEKKAGQVTVNFRNEETGKIQRLKVTLLDLDYQVEFELFDLPIRLVVSAPGVALRLRDGGTAGVQAYLLYFDPAANKFEWVKDSAGKHLAIHNPTTELSSHGGLLVESTSGSGYHEVACFKPSATAGRMQLLGTASWMYPDVWEITGYSEGHVRHTRLTDSDRSTRGTCGWALDLLAKSR